MRAQILLGIAAILIALSPIRSYAFTTGEELQHGLSVCLKKEDAIAIAKAFEESREASNKVWESLPECMNIPVVGPKVGRVVYTAKRGKEVMRVVEIVYGGTVVAYFLTSDNVGPDPKSERAS